MSITNIIADLTHFIQITGKSPLIGGFSPTIYKDMIVYGTSDSHLVIAQNKNTGEVLWEKKVPMRVYGTAVVHKDVIYFGCFDGILYGVDPKTGKTIWTYQTAASKKNYSSMFDKNGDFVEGFNLYGAGYLESEKKIHLLGSILSTPTISDGIIYFGSSDGHVYAVRI
jgi:outer membrane protein assembly factor BamB